MPLHSSKIWLNAQKYLFLQEIINLITNNMKKNFVKPRWLFTMLLFVTTMIMPTMMLAKESITPKRPKGDGKTEPYQISSREELYWFARLVNGTLKDEEKDVSANAILTDDIIVNTGVLDANKNLVSGKDFIPWEPIGTSYSDDKAYSGTFDGNKHTISGLYFDKTRSYQVGLFGYIGAKGKLFNVGVLDSYFQFSAEGGGVCGVNCGVLQNCSNSSTVIGTGQTAIIGGVCGTNSGTVRDCKNTGSVRGHEKIGGVCGRNEFNAIIENCFNEGTFSETVKSVGGVCGENGGTIKSCYNTASVSGTDYLGGVCGSNSDDGTITNCFNEGTVSGQYSVGGVCGSNSDGGTITNCFNKGTVNGADFSVGGVCGNNDLRCTIKSCYNTGSVNGTGDSVGGVCGYAYGGTTNCYYLSGTATRGIGGNGKAEEMSKEQFKSGEVAWLLNGSTSVPTEGSTLAWYQKLGENGDEYPVLTPKDGNTVYNNYYTCSDKQVNIFSNTEANAHEKYDKHDKGTETLLANGLYSFTCQRCQANFVYIKDFCGIKDNNIELTVDPYGSYTAVKPVDINDNTPYNSPVDFTAPTLNYTRNYLGADQWQAVYVPFETQATDWTGNDITVASINNFHEYEKKDGSGYETVLEVKKATSGEFEANTPYLLRTKDSGSKTITIYYAKLHKASSEKYYCMSMTRKYDFTGIYTRQSGLGQDGSSVAVYALNQQGLIAPLNPSTEVGAQRWYLTVSNRNGSNMSQASKSRSINIDEVGEGATTAIKGIQVITNNEADNTSLNGIYDLQGRKLSKEPTHGIYIKNGKKYVK